MDGTTPTGATKRTLRALASGAPGDDPPARVVDDATDALESVETATRLVDAGGVGRLARAVAGAARDGDDATVRRGREALAGLCAFRAALDGDAATRDAAGRPRR
ncbi:hypothetical protein [Salinigranum salinum]|uniref:hypothetical protein n=1 Tax=Salinigranum salinum TaxID=1364937 RepID=UPI00186458FB|nr:hypothetical protein [Salinigranum salinum]